MDKQKAILSSNNTLERFTWGTASGGQRQAVLSFNVKSDNDDFELKIHILPYSSTLLTSPPTNADYIYTIHNEGTYHLAFDGILGAPSNNVDVYVELSQWGTNTKVAMNDVSIIANSLKEGYTASIVQYADYYPYGMAVLGRNNLNNSTKYDFGFNGMEMNNAIKGSGNHYTTHFRQYDPRLARWHSPDPVVQPYMSAYSAFDMNPVYYADPRGDETTGGDKKSDNKGNDAEVDESMSSLSHGGEGGEAVGDTEIGKMPMKELETSSQDNTKLAEREIVNEGETLEYERSWIDLSGSYSYVEAFGEGGKSLIIRPDDLSNRGIAKSIFHEDNHIVLNFKVSDNPSIGISVLENPEVFSGPYEDVEYLLRNASWFYQAKPNIGLFKVAGYTVVTISAVDAHGIEVFRAKAAMVNMSVPDLKPNIGSEGRLTVTSSKTKRRSGWKDSVKTSIVNNNLKVFMQAVRQDSALGRRLIDAFLTD